MKKLLANKSLKRKKKLPASSRITNETVAEHRERVLAGGRRYKYPIQYARHKLVKNAIIVALFAVVLMLALAWQQLYVAQNSSLFFYRLTQFLPVPVASVDGSFARYSDYLLNYRPSAFYLENFDEIKPKTDDGKLQLEYKKREALDAAIADTYAKKIARDKGISVSGDEISQALAKVRAAENGVLSEEAQSASAKRVFDLSPADMRQTIANSLLRAKVSYAIDQQAEARQSEVATLLKKHKNDFEKVTDEMNKKHNDSVSTGKSGTMSRTNIFNGVSVSQIAKLEKGKTSDVIKSATADAYYYVTVTEKTDRQIAFDYIRIPLTQFLDDLAKLRESGKITEFINVRDLDGGEK